MGVHVSVSTNQNENQVNITVLGLNGTFTQYVKKIARSNDDKLAYAPEHFNISKEFAPFIQITDYDGTIIDGKSAY